MESAAHAPAMRAAGSPQRVQLSPPRLRALGDRVIRAGGIDGITRFDALSSVIGHWVRQARLGRCTRTDAWRETSAWNASQVAPPWDEPRLQREFEAIERRDRGSHPETGMVRLTGGNPIAGDSETLSDDGLALRFATTVEGQLRHAPQWGQWFLWSGTRWQRDETGQAQELARAACRDAAPRAASPSEARRIASQKTIAAVLRLAATDPRLATSINRFDSHDMVLNTPAGVIDL